MAPSIAEIPTAEVVVPVKVDTKATSNKPKVRRIIDEEGGKSTASVRISLPLTAAWLED
jgi:taurine dioxygenase/sulfonate dioxygenase